MNKTEEDELSRKAEEQSHDEIVDPDLTVDGLTEEEEALEDDDPDVEGLDSENEPTGIPKKPTA
jgi:hypothetical protein